MNTVSQGTFIITSNFPTKSYKVFAIYVVTKIKIGGLYWFALIHHVDDVRRTQGDMGGEGLSNYVCTKVECKFLNNQHARVRAHTHTHTHTHTLKHIHSTPHTSMVGF